MKLQATDSTGLQQPFALPGYIALDAMSNCSACVYSERTEGYYRKAGRLFLSGGRAAIEGIVTHGDVCDCLAQRP